MRDEIGETCKVWVILGFVSQVSRNKNFILKTIGTIDGFKWWSNIRFIMFIYNYSCYCMENGFQGDKDRI